MTASHTRTPYPHPQPELPLRNRAYSHLDNLPRNDPYSNMDDKVNGIKKKYDRPQARPKGNEENFKSTFDFPKSVSIYEPSEDTPQSPYRKPCLTPTANRDRKANNFQADFSRQVQGKPGFQRETSYSGRQEIKSQLESNRMTLNAMKSELQSKLNDLNNKTKASSTAYQPPAHSQSTYEETNNTYEAILSKYSKNNDFAQSTYKYSDDALGKKEAFNDTATINAKPRYTSKVGTADKRQNLSIISEMPSSDPKELPYDHEENGFKRRQALTNNQKAESITSKSYIKGNYDRFSSNYPNEKTNLEFTLQKKEPEPEKKSEQGSYLSKYMAEKSYKGETQTKYKDYKYEKPVEIEESRSTGIQYPLKSIELERSELQQLKDRYELGTRSSQIPNYKNTPKAQTRDNQAITKEIQKLDMKIKQIEQNKKELNINFKPYDPSKSVSKQGKTPQHYKAYEDVPANEPNRYNMRSQAVPIERTRQYQESNQPQASKTYSNNFGIKYASSHKDEEEPTERSISDNNFRNKANSYFNKFIEEKRPQVQERKARPQQSFNNTIKGLVKALGEQASLDETFRNNKIWFTGQSQQKKWGELKRELQSQGISLSESQMKEVFSLEESQNNPFFSVSETQCSLRSLVQSYQSAQRNWQSKIAHKFSRSELQSEGFNAGKIDCDRKGCIQVQDLVRFLNIQSGTFLRNRDVSIIFKRIGKGKAIQFPQLLSYVCQ